MTELFYQLTDLLAQAYNVQRFCSEVTANLTAGNPILKSEDAFKKLTEGTEKLSELRTEINETILGYVNKNKQ